MTAYAIEILTGSLHHRPILIAVWRNEQSLTELRKQHIITVPFVVVLIFKLCAFTVEANDPADFGDEIPVLILLIMTLLNRFL